MVVTTFVSLVFLDVQIPFLCDVQVLILCPPPEGGVRGVRLVLIHTTFTAALDEGLRSYLAGLTVLDGDCLHGSRFRYGERFAVERA